MATSSIIIGAAAQEVSNKQHRCYNTMAQKDDDDNGKDRKMTEAEAAIIEFMKQKAALEASAAANANDANDDDSPKEHKFWDTQVSYYMMDTMLLLWNILTHLLFY